MPQNQEKKIQQKKINFNKDIIIIIRSGKTLKFYHFLNTKCTPNLHCIKFCGKNKPSFETHITKHQSKIYMNLPTNIKLKRKGNLHFANTLCVDKFFLAQIIPKFHTIFRVYFAGKVMFVLIENRLSWI